MLQTTDPLQGRASSDAGEEHRSFRICDGKVLIFHRADSPNWYAQWRRNDGSQFQRGLRTADRAAAIEVARTEYMKYTFREEHGLSETTKGFGTVADVLLAELEAKRLARGEGDGKVKAYRQRIERYLKPYFGQRPIDQIRPADIEKYRDWRLAYWITGPGSKQEFLEYRRAGKAIRAPLANRRKGNGDKALGEDVTLRQIFACAVKNGWLEQGRVPLVKSRRPSDKSRPHFTPAEVDALMVSAPAWIEAAPYKRSKPIRRLTTDFITLLFATGMRPSEAIKLTWGDVEFFRDEEGIKNLRLWVSDDTKTGKREVVALPGAEVVIMRMRAERTKAQVQPDQWLFTTTAGRRVTDFGRLMKAWLLFAKVRTNPRGEPRSVYSCRHTYITNALNRGLSTHLIAVNCGTSTDMIDKFYSKVSASLNASKLSGRAP